LADYLACCSHPVTSKSEKNWLNGATVDYVDFYDYVKMLERERYERERTYTCTHTSQAVALKGDFTVIIPSIAGVLGKRSVLEDFARSILRKQAEDVAKDYKCVGQCYNWGGGGKRDCVRSVNPPKLEDCIVTGSQGGKYKQEEYSMEGKYTNRTTLIGKKSSIIASTTLIICWGEKPFTVTCSCPGRPEIGPR